MKTGEIIKSLRQAARLSQQELAEKAGYTDRSSIAKIESGKVDLPESKIKQFADLFGVSIDYLLGNVSEPYMQLDTERMKNYLNSYSDDEEEELNEILTEMRSRSDMRMLFKVAKDATPEDVRQAVKIIEALRRKD